MPLKYDTELDLAIGKSRRELNWRNQQMTWSQLASRLSKTHRTPETMKEYLAAKKSRQDEIKDIGGFVGGYLTGGKRRKANVLHRTLVTLDLDQAAATFWQDFTLLYDNAAVLYSTHKHTPEAPRLRLVMPLDREVYPDEYEAIARRIAASNGIEQFDPTTYQPERLMYWPSTSSDGEYVYELQDGPLISADSVLATYRNWRDHSEWPMAPGEQTKLNKEIKKQGNPLDKPGLVGAFCRSYSISEAIEAFLSDVYEPTAIEGRYTYLRGSTSGGLVVYDDLYAYSHHGTDPTCGHLCNAFDLVRLHLYGLQDEDSAPNTAINKLPSYTAMTELASKDSKVKTAVASERMERIRQDFGSMEVGEDGRLEAGICNTYTSSKGVAEHEPPAGAPEDTGWIDQLELDSRGQFQKTTDNIVLIIENDPRLKGKFAYNAFTHRELVMGPLPWRHAKRGEYLKNVDLIALRHFMEKEWGIYHTQKVGDGFTEVMHRHSFHPVRQYLAGLRWDGQERLDTLLIDYLGAEDTPYTRAVTRKAFVAAVARVMRPGIKFDYVLTLVGPQGCGKSSLARKMGKQWYCENLTTLQGKEASEQLQGVWIMEMGELAGLKKAEFETIKNFISRQEDSFRPAYAEKKETYLRECIFIGTTNNPDFLRDPTGNRRFWPVSVSPDQAIFSVHADLDDRAVDQLWAEAQELFRSGEPLFLDSEMEEMAREVQVGHTEVDDRAHAIYQYLERPITENWSELNVYERRAFHQDPLAMKNGVPRTEICVPEIWCELMNKNIGDMTTQNTKPLHNIMNRMPGWKKSKWKRIFGIYGKQVAYLREGSGE